MNNYDDDRFEVNKMIIFDLINMTVYSTMIDNGTSTLGILQDMDNLESKVTTPEFNTVDELIESLKG